MTTIGVCCGKASPGASFVSVNLAAAIAKSNSTLLVDLDLSGGDLVAYLGIDPRKGLHLLSKLAGPSPSGDQLRAEVQEAFGFGVIGGLTKPVDADVIDPLAIADGCRGLAQVVIFDLGRLPGPSLQATKRMDLVLVVVRPDVVSVLGAERCLAAFENSKNNPQLVIAAHRRRHLSTSEDVGRALGNRVAGVVPWAPRAARRALEQQRPISTGPVARAFRTLAARLTEEKLSSGDIAQRLTAASA